MVVTAGKKGPSTDNAFFQLEVRVCSLTTAEIILPLCCGHASSVYETLWILSLHVGVPAERLLQSAKAKGIKSPTCVVSWQDLVVSGLLRTKHNNDMILLFAARIVCCCTPNRRLCSRVLGLLCCWLNSCATGFGSDMGLTGVLRSRLPGRCCLLSLTCALLLVCRTSMCSSSCRGARSSSAPDTSPSNVPHV